MGSLVDACLPRLVYECYKNCILKFNSCCHLEEKLGGGEGKKGYLARQVRIYSVRQNNRRLRGVVRPFLLTWSIHSLHPSFRYSHASAVATLETAHRIGPSFRQGHYFRGVVVVTFRNEYHVNSPTYPFYNRLTFLWTPALA